MFPNLDNPDRPASLMRSRVLWALASFAIILVIYVLGMVAWPVGPLFVLRLSLKPLSLLILIWLGAIGMGDLSLAALRLQPTHWERLLFSAALGLTLWWIGLLGLGLLGFFRGYLAWAFLVGLGVLGLWRWPLVIAGSRLPKLCLTKWSMVLWAIILMSLLYPLLAYGLLPPLDWDEVAYHLAIPKIYIAAGRIINIPYIVHSNWPFGLEMLYTQALLLGSSGEVLVHMIHWSLVLLTSAGVWYLGAQQRQTIGLLGVAIFLSLPVIKEITGVGMVDIGTAAYSCLSFAAWWRWRTDRNLRWLFLAGLLAGGAASLKLTSAAVALLLSIMTLLSSTDTRLKVRLKNAVLVGLIALTVVSPWYIKSWVFTGDPIYPFGIRFFPASHWDALGHHYLYHYLHSTNMPFTIAAYLIGPLRLIRYPQRFDWLSLGYVLVWLLPLGLIEIRREKLVRWLLFFILAYYSIWFCLTHQIRFLLPMLPMGALLAAFGGSWVIARLGLVGKAALIACLLSELPLVQAAPRATLLDRLPYLSGRQTRNELLTHEVKPFPVFEYINHSLPTKARVLLATYENRGYYLDREYVWANMIGQRFLRFEQIPNGGVLREILAANGIDYLLDNRHEWDKTLTAIQHYDHLINLLDELIAAYGEKLYSEGGITVYRLKAQEAR